MPPKLLFLALVGSSDCKNHEFDGATPESNSLTDCSSTEWQFAWKMAKKSRTITKVHLVFKIT